MIEAITNSGIKYNESEEMVDVCQAIQKIRMEERSVKFNPYFRMIRIVLAGESAGLPGKYFHNKTRSVYNLPYQTKTVFTI